MHFYIVTSSRIKFKFTSCEWFSECFLSSEISLNREFDVLIEKLGFYQKSLFFIKKEMLFKI